MTDLQAAAQQQATSKAGHQHSYIANNTKGDYLKRLRRIEGQARGLQRMVEEDVDALEQFEVLRSHFVSLPRDRRGRPLRPPRVDQRGPTSWPDSGPNPVKSLSPHRGHVSRRRRQAPSRFDRGVTLPVLVPTSTRHAVRLVGLVVVLAGLFGMHGLSGQGGGLGGGPNSDHGAAGMSTVTAPPALMAASSAATTSLMSMDATDLAAISTVSVSDVGAWVGSQAEDLFEAATGSGHGTDSGGMAMGAMCLAILGAALLALARLLRRARVAPVGWSLPRPARAILPRGRDPDPPSLIKLSIQRC